MLPANRARNGTPDKGPIPGVRGSLGIATTLKVSSVAVVLTFMFFMFASFLSIHSIDESFSRASEVDRPMLDAAKEMDDAADETMIAFLESLVTDTTQSSDAARAAFTDSMRNYKALIHGSHGHELSGSASRLFEELDGLGQQLVSSDQLRRSTFADLQTRFEALDDEAEGALLGSFEGDIEENARMVGNYSADPSVHNKEEALEEFGEFIDEIIEAREEARGPSERRVVQALLVEVRDLHRSLHLIIALTERSTEILPEFLKIRIDLDEVLEDGIYTEARAHLAARAHDAGLTVRSSKLVLIFSLAFGALVGIGGLLWVRRRITRPVERLMSQIARHDQSDSTNEDLAQRGEFGVLARAFADAASQRTALENELRRQALEDPLTGLANRTMFKDRVEQALVRRRTDEKGVAVAFLDLDDFKTINDSLGHTAGDELLVIVAQRIKESVRTSDTPARLGGDEFAVLLDDVDDVATPARRILQTLAKPISLNGKPVVVHGSVGIALHQPGETAADLLRNADVAMYRAKSEGKGNFKTFDQTMQGVAIERFDLKNELLCAIDNDEFVLHYQPIMDLTSGRKTAIEALLRWEHPSRGMVSPADFIPLAEETGAIVPIGRWVLDTACAQVAAWRLDPDSSDLRVCVNVSPSQLSDPNLVQDVDKALTRAGLPAEALVLEITESAFLLSDEEPAVTMRALSDLGVVIALDDFGAGYTSLSYLSKLPIGTLKMDRTFVDAIDKGAEPAAVAHAIIKLGQALGLEVIAEGIETPEQLAELQRHGCSLGQGFLLGRPSAPTHSRMLVSS